jgi:peptide/nickel transport system permease protein
MTIGIVLTEDKEPTVPTDPRGPGRNSLLGGIVRRPLALVSALFLLVVIIGSFLAPLIAPYGPLDANYAITLQGPTAAHIFGTDTLGRDVFSRMLYAGASAIGNVVIAIIVALVLAVPLGVFFGLLRGWLDVLGSRIADIVLSIPGIIILLMALALFDQNMTIAMVALGVLSAPGLYRVVRSASISVGSEPYIDASRVSGLTKLQLALRHVLPRVTGPIVVNTSIVAASALLTQTGLNFLGLGVTPPDPSWGSIMADGSAVMAEQPSLLFFSGLVVAVTILAIVLLGDGVRDAASERWAGRRHRAPRRSRATTTKATLTRLTEQLPAQLTEVTDAVIDVRHLTVGFPAAPGSATEWQPVIRDISFQVARGESVGIVGESGCGKTITGLSVLGLLPQGASVLDGSVALAGTDTATMTPKERAALRGSTIAFVSQEPMVGLDPLYTVKNQIVQAIRSHRKLSRAAATVRARELLEQVRIVDPEKVLASYPHQISGGMAQRVAIAIALAGDPDVIVADEPTTALDVTVQSEIVQLLRLIQKERGMGILVISHDWGVISELCDKAVVMYAGEVVEYGAVAEVMAAPTHPYTRGLLAANPALAVPGARLPTIPGTVPAPAAWPTGCHFLARCQFATTDCAAAPIPLEVHRDDRVARCIRVEDIDLELEEVAALERADSAR